MNYLSNLNIDLLEDLNLSSIRIDLPSATNNVEFQSDDSISKEEMEFAISCAMNIKKHLSRAIRSNKEGVLLDKLDYINCLLSDAGLKASAL